MPVTEGLSEYWGERDGFVVERLFEGVIVAFVSIRNRLVEPITQSVPSPLIATISDASKLKANDPNTVPLLFSSTSVSR